jgi:hypothetical protein
MALSGVATQGKAGHRDAPSQAHPIAGTPSVVVMMMVMPATVPAGRLAAHCDTAGRAELPRFRFHAGGDPGDIGNDIGAKPHRIGRARLTGGLAALSVCSIETEIK